jgi:hypothetical protein
MSDDPPEKTADARSYADFASRTRAKLAAIGPAPAWPTITPEQRAALQDAFRRELPRFERRVPTSTIEDNGHPFFRKVRVLRLADANFPAELAFAAWTSFGPIVLSGNPVALVAMCADERPAYVEDLDLAIVLANIAGVWAGASLMSFVQLASVEDIPFRRAGPADLEAEARIREAYASRIHPPRVETFAGGVRVTMWLVSESKLRLRVSETRPNLVTTREDVVAEVPAHPGRGWRMVGKRFVPVM